MARLLIVDDETLVGALLEDVLGAFGYQILRAESATDGWDVFQGGNPDAVIVDHRLGPDPQLPFESGLELARRIKMISPETPVVMVSVEPPTGAGDVCDAVFVKPVRFRDLQEALLRLGVTPD